MNWKIALERARETSKKQYKKSSDGTLTYPWNLFQQVWPSGEFVCVFCQDGLFGAPTAVWVGVYEGSVRVCPCCGVTDGPWISGDMGW